MTKLDKYCITMALLVVITWLFIDIYKTDEADKIHMSLAYGFLVLVSACFGKLMSKFDMDSWRSFFIHNFTICVALYFWYWSKPEDSMFVYRALPFILGTNFVTFLSVKYWRIK